MSGGPNNFHLGVLKELKYKMANQLTVMHNLFPKQAA